MVGGSKSPPFFLNHHRVENYNIGLPMLVPGINPKSTTFLPLIEIEEKNSKKVFFWVFVPVKIP
jgi:hypothetical protein